MSLIMNFIEVEQWFYNYPLNNDNETEFDYFTCKSWLEEYEENQFYIKPKNYLINDELFIKQSENILIFAKDYYKNKQFIDSVFDDEDMKLLESLDREYRIRKYKDSNEFLRGMKAVHQNYLFKKKSDAEFFLTNNSYMREEIVKKLKNEIDESEFPIGSVKNLDSIHLWIVDHAKKSRYEKLNMFKLSINNIIQLENTILKYKANYKDTTYSIEPNPYYSTYDHNRNVDMLMDILQELMVSKDSHKIYNFN